MTTVIKKKNIKIKNKSVPIDLFFLDALSIKHFDTLYEGSKQETNALVRELVKEEEGIHPQIVERAILTDFFNRKVEKEFRKGLHI